MSTKHEDRYLPPGTIVKHFLTVSGDDYDPSNPATWEDVPEYGVVINCWRCPEMFTWDCLIAFWGQSFPSQDEPLEKPPYILRYFSTSLEVLHEAVHTPDFPAIGRKP